MYVNVSGVCIMNNNAFVSVGAMCEISFKKYIPIKALDKKLRSIDHQ